MHKILEQLESELATVLHGLDARQAQLTPAQHPEKWNVQQVVEHLLMSFRTTTAVIQVRIDKGSPTLAKPMLRQKMAQVSLIAMGYFPRGRKAPSAVSPAFPASLRTGEELTRKVHEELSALDTASDKAEEMFGGIRCVSHIVMGPLSIPQWRKFHLVHGEHHVKQIRRIRQDHQV